MTNIFSEDFLKHHTAVLGKTGKGKTSTAKLMIEQVAKKSRVCVLDTIKSDWWGLTSSASGKRAGLPFRILGGPRGHLPLHAGSGKILGEIIARGDLPLSIIDMANFDPGEPQGFFSDFAGALFKNIRGVLYLVIEEAHEVAPKELSGFGRESMAIYWAKKLATAGRKKGIRLVVTTQRTQALHNAVLGSCENLIAHAMTAPADQEPVFKWLKANTRDKSLIGEIEGSLSGLPVGTGWVCSPEDNVFEVRKFPRIKTFDNTATPTDDSDTTQVRTAQVDLDKLRSILGEAAKQAEDNDLPRLRRKMIERDQIIAAQTRKIADLEKRPAAVTKPNKDQIESIEKQAYARGVRDGVKKSKTVSLALDRALSASERLIESLNSTKKILAVDVKVFIPPSISIENKVSNASRSVPVHKSPPIAPVQLDTPLKAERKPLAALASVYPSGMTEARWAVASGLKRSGTWSTYLSRLRTAGRIEKRGDDYFATEQGIADLGGNIPQLPEPGPRLVEFWGSRLKAVRPMLSILLSAYPEFITRNDLAARLKMAPSSGTYSTYLSRIRSPGLIEEDDKRLRLSAEIMGSA